MSLQLQPNSYYTFYDDHMQNWSVTFESEKSSSDFCREVSDGPALSSAGAGPAPSDLPVTSAGAQVCLAKANSAAPLDAALVQDLRVGEGQAVEPGDFLEVSYTGWLLHNHVIGPVRELASWRLCGGPDLRITRALMGQMSHLFQVFDSNQSKDKLLRFKVGSGRVIRVSLTRLF